MEISNLSSIEDDRSGFLARAVAGSGELRACITLVAISAAVFVICVPYVRVPLHASPAFVAAYNSVSTLTDFTTSIFLFGQFCILRSPALLLLASGYLFSSLISLVQLLTFPGMFTSINLLGAGPQTSLWLCVFWHGGFPLVIIIYALCNDSNREMVGPPRIAIAGAVTAVIGAVLACWSAATWGAENARVLPALLNENGFTPWQRVINLTDIALVVVAFVLLSVRSQRRLINLWLMVVMGDWLCDITLSSYLNSGRYDFGFYAGRVYGAFAASVLLAVLVLENSRLYWRLANAASCLKERAMELLQANESLRSEIDCRQQAEERLRRSQAELARISRMTAMGELSFSLADQVNHPIGAILMNAETCLRWLSAEMPNVEKARSIASMIVKDGARASEIVARMQQLFEKRVRPRESTDVNDLIRETIALLRGETARLGASVDIDLMENLSRVKGDRVQLQQALMNLMINAIEAMNDSDEMRRLTVVSERAENDHIKVSVCDTGTGLPPLQMNQIFKSFFTTKRDSVGIGLSISSSIIEEHGGRLWATNNPSRGASFHFTLPIEGEPHH